MWERDEKNNRARASFLQDEKTISSEVGSTKRIRPRQVQPPRLQKAKAWQFVAVYACLNRM